MREIIFILFSLLALTSCSTPVEGVKEEEQQQGQTISPGVADLVYDNAVFGFNVYSQLAKKEGNLFFSPYSLSQAMAMTLEGAVGNTRLEMARVLNYAIQGDALDASIAELNELLIPSDTPVGNSLKISNSLWLQTGYKFLPNFQSSVSRHFHASLEQVDFAKNVDKARSSINMWVSKSTNGKIRDLLSAGDLDAMTRLVLVNAVYMKSPWQNPFSPRLSELEVFHGRFGKISQEVMMHQTVNLPYFKGDGFSALELPYEIDQLKGPKLAMLIFLPESVNGIVEFESQLKASKFIEWLGRFKTQRVEVAIPKFKITDQFALKDVLINLGMIEPFSTEADFSGISGAKDLKLDKVLQQAFVNVDEYGTEAAAATAVTMRLTSVKEPLETVVFKADHPFFFVIIDRVTNAVIFMGRFEGGS